MLPTLLAWFLLWVIYIWLDRRCLIRLLKPKRSTPAYQPPPKLEFDNPRKIAEINRARRRARWVPPDLPPIERKERSPQEISPKPPSPPPAPIQPAPPQEPPQEQEKPTPQPVPAKEEARPQLVKTATQVRLLMLVHNDRQVAKRLVESTRCKNPGKTDQWCCEKVIWDLERDRK